MGCLIALLSIISPRLALVAVFLFTDLLSRAYESWVLPALGFLLLPWTTLAYAVMWEVGTNGVTGFEWFFVVLGFLFDIGSHGHSAREQAERS